jgi:hypothetical protein
MPRTHHRGVAAVAAVSLLLLTALLLSACGGSSKGSSSTAAAATGAQRGGQFRARAASVRACLQKNGVTLPKRPTGSGQGAPGEGGAPGRRGPFGSGAAGTPQLPKGVTRAQLEAAFKKCGGGTFARNRGFDSAAGRQRYAKFAQCMRKNGVELPAPNTSGKGPIFDTKGIDTSSAAFKAADAKCMKELRPSGGAAGEGPPAPGEGAAAPGADAGPPAGAPPAGAPPGGQ